jgi:hypothetical protein
VNTRNPDESTARPQIDVAVAVRRGQRGFVIRLAGMWVAVLAATVVLVVVGALARSYLRASSVSWRLNPATSQGAGTQLLLLTAALLAAAGLTLAVRRLRLREVRRGRRGVVIRLAGKWVAVLAATVVLITVGAVTLSYLGAPSIRWRLNPATSLGAGAPVILLAAALLAAAGLTAAIGRLQLRSRRPLVHAPSVRAVAEPGPPGQVSVRSIGTAVTHTVRIEPSPGASITTIEEVRP